MASFAVFTRTHWLEGPYLNEFIAWYKYLGFQKIYIINTESRRKKLLLEYIDDCFLSMIDITNFDGAVDSFPYARKVFNKMEEDYVLHVDTDEFLVLPNGYKSIGDFINDNKYDLYQFHWVLTPINKFVQASMLDYLYEPGATCKPAAARKMMARRQAWLDDPDSKIHMHYMKCKGTKVAFDNHKHTFKVDGTQPFILHFSVRGYLHTLYKIKHQRFSKSCRKNLKQFLEGECDYPQSPLRFNIAIAELYGSQQPIDTQKWNLPDKLDYKKSNTQDLLKLYGSLEDQFNLTEKIQNAISLLKSCDAPITINAGLKYDGTCRSHLKKYLNTVV